MSLNYEFECDLELEELNTTRANTPNLTHNFANKLASDKGHVKWVSQLENWSHFDISSNQIGSVVHTEMMKNYEQIDEVDCIIFKKNKFRSKKDKKKYTSTPQPLKVTRMMSSTALLTQLIN